ncbi:hypothetical protein CERSUDRAFT_122431 [Gelatoporia subvermispora B]|uniref:Uncharacterized protein n=1 Tax=Ceriporiopsis subvermispora (strain B) TaxID=914234 RepID=M2R322_CERS8|nr:hypothetical protein CERSUDRAFT_122431 [Gelatoporia subvermispora B]
MSPSQSPRSPVGPHSPQGWNVAAGNEETFQQSTVHHGQNLARSPYISYTAQAQSFQGQVPITAPPVASPYPYPPPQWGTNQAQHYYANPTPVHRHDGYSSTSSAPQHNYRQISTGNFGQSALGAANPSQYRQTYAGQSGNLLGPDAAYWNPSAGGVMPPATASHLPGGSAGAQTIAPSQLSSAAAQYGGAGRTVAQNALSCGPSQNGIMIPQRTYQPLMQSDRRRYVEEVTLEEPIMFYVYRPQYISPGFHPAARPQLSCGVSLRDCINNRFDFLEGREELMFVDRGPSISIRLMWPGYAPWSRQIPTRDFRSPPGPITRSKLARNVAKTVQRFIEASRIFPTIPHTDRFTVQEMQDRPMEDQSQAIWKVGTGSIGLDDLILLGLQHVSMGSWQAHLLLIRN